MKLSTPENQYPVNLRILSGGQYKANDIFLWVIVFYLQDRLRRVVVEYPVAGKQNYLCFTIFCLQELWFYGIINHFQFFCFQKRNQKASYALHTTTHYITLGEANTRTRL
jgi:hypothetical protein